MPFKNPADPRSHGDQDESTDSSTTSLPMDDYPMPPRLRITCDSFSTEWVSTIKRLLLSVEHMLWVDVTLTDLGSMDLGNSPQPHSVTNTSDSCTYISELHWGDRLADNMLQSGGEVELAKVEGTCSVRRHKDQVTHDASVSTSLRDRNTPRSFVNLD